MASVVLRCISCDISGLEVHVASVVLGSISYDISGLEVHIMRHQWS